ncbi:DUF423 domain-containing protein [Psychrobacter sp. FDAARGOS_221]|uniref:DUF423 domain-containing protein n=1 Tax=Psychrobacter sp. FDAARGOS_221 TaxID=1975705 RepID=UPI000BB56B5B|nr:DUF423 domain-containing protein [Psychrobacter sp. FDAARGOS_221]PNK60398.1 DUF423 domain-containing protein [Psychrobacter sp. FDAARGOS_221]
MNWIAIAALNLALAVALGAFGAHGIKSFASPEQMAWWHTATQYYFYHGLGLLVIGYLIKQGMVNSTAAWLIQVGVLIFAASLYAMTLGAPRWFGAITPIGGSLMVIGWLWLAFAAFKSPQL